MESDESVLDDGVVIPDYVEGQGLRSGLACCPRTTDGFQAGSEEVSRRCRALKGHRCSWEPRSELQTLPCEYFEETTHDLRSEKVEAFNLGFSADAVAIVDGLMAVYTYDSIVIYKWDDSMRFKKIRTIKQSLLQFLVRTGNLNEGSALVLMQMLLFLIKNGVERCDLFVERAMLLLGIEDVLEMWIVDGELHCKYKSLVTRVYDRKLRLLRTCLVPGLEPRPWMIDYGSVKITTEKDSVVIDRGRSFVEKIRLGQIRQTIPVKAFLFLLTDESLKVLRFSE